MKKLEWIVIPTGLSAAMLAGGYFHTVTPATCKEPEICKECGETQGSPRGHEWAEANCEEPEICNVCGEEGKVFGHVFSGATCEKPQICHVCGEFGDAATGHNWKGATYDAPETCSVCKETRGEKLTHPSEWGFYNLEDMGFGLVSIYGYDLTEKGKEYVMVSGYVSKFENGYQMGLYMYEEDGKCVLKRQAGKKEPSPFSIVNNDNVIFEYGHSSYTINERKTVFSRDNFVIFVDEHGEWDIPYSLIDWDRVLDIVTNEDGTTSNIMYLVPKK